MKQTITAVIPVRAGSVRVKNKNILPFGDSNLLIHKIRQLKEVRTIDNIVVSSDSDLMLEMAEKEGVKTHRRSLPYADEKTKSFNEVVENVVLGCEGDHIIWAPCVCPFVESHHFSDAIDLYREKVLMEKTFDSLTSVKLLKEYICDGENPLNYTFGSHVPSQDLPSWYIIVNGFYITPRDVMLQKKYFLGDKPYLFEVDKIAAIDIDDELDMVMVYAIHEYKKNHII